MSKMKRVRRKLVKKRRGRAARSATPSSRLADLAEAQEILLPELAARIAALEHLLMEKRICTREELIQARRFIDPSTRATTVGRGLAQDSAGLRTRRIS
jgi:hypothetical protein